MMDNVIFNYIGMGYEKIKIIVELQCNMQNE